MGWIGGGGGGGPPGPPGPTGPAGVGVTDNYNCPTSVAVNDVVYESAGSNNVDRANATSTATGPAIGFVISKPTTTTCIVQFMGPVSGFTGLTPDTQYYLTTANGAISTTPPSGSGNTVQKVGVAKSTTVLEILIDQTVTEL